MFVQSEAYIYEDDKNVVLCSFNYGLGNIQLNLTRFFKLFHSFERLIIIIIIN
jgi:hypothetical protein